MHPSGHEPSGQEPSGREPAGQAASGDAVRPAFPSESEWLALEPPAIRPDFVASTLRLVMAGALPVADDADLDEPAVPAEILQQFAPPPPSPAFVVRTLQALRSDRQARWLALLSRYVAPQPSPDFVARTVAALRAPAPARRLWPRLAVTGLVAAAAALLAVVLWFDRGPIGLDRAIAEFSPELRASTWTSSALPAVLVQVQAASSPGELPTAPIDGAFVLLRSTGARSIR